MNIIIICHNFKLIMSHYFYTRVLAPFPNYFKQVFYLNKYIKFYFLI